MSTSPRTPYAIVCQVERTRESPKSALIAMSRGLEREALADPPREAAATLQDVRFLTPETRQVYATLAERGARCRLFARSLHAWLAPGVTGIQLAEDDPLVDEWTVVLPSSTHPVVLAAIDCGLTGVEDRSRAFSWAVWRDAEVVRAVGDCLGLGLGTVRTGG